MKRSICYMPEEVVEEILLRLPPKSLMRFKCVCKSWYTLISDPSFVDKHLRIGIDNCKKSSSLSIFLGWTRQELSLDHIFNNRSYADLDKILSLVTISDGHDSTSSDNQLPCVIEEINLPPTLEEVVNKLETFVSLHCNGIICLFDCFALHEKAIILCNPLLRDFKLLHTPRFDPEFKVLGRGFGYDAKANDYKYVKLCFCTSDLSLSRALVYTLGIDSWKEIEIDLEGRFCLPCAMGVYCRGVYYWVNKSLPHSEHMILSFDMSDEVFQHIPLPDHIKRVDGKSAKRIAVWNESLVLLFCPENLWFSTSFEIWVMADNTGAAEGFPSWKKHFTIRPQACINFSSLLTFWKNDEILFETRDGRLVSCNLYSQKIRKLPIHGAVLPGRTCADVYLRSIVSVRRGTHARHWQN